MSSKAHSVADIAYFAGIVDGEGSIAITLANRRENYTLYLRIGNTDKNLIIQLQKKFGGTSYIQKAGKSTWKHAYILSWFGPVAQDRIRMVLPFLIVKREQALNALAFPFIGYKWRSDEVLKEKQKTCYLIIKRLNKRGTK
jgi:hypothetical protein